MVPDHLPLSHEALALVDSNSQKKEWHSLRGAEIT